jgi:elongation factor P
MDRVEQAHLEVVDMEFLYMAGEDAVFMNQENYEQLTPLARGHRGRGQFISFPTSSSRSRLYEESPWASSALTVDIKVVKTEPFLKGATQSASYKPAVLETGLTVMVPPFINEDRHPDRHPRRQIPGAHQELIRRSVSRRRRCRAGRSPGR